MRNRMCVGKCEIQQALFSIRYFGQLLEYEKHYNLNILEIDLFCTLSNELGKLTSSTLGMSIIKSLSFHFDTFHYHNSGKYKTISLTFNR